MLVLSRKVGQQIDFYYQDRIVMKVVLLSVQRNLIGFNIYYLLSNEDDFITMGLDEIRAFWPVEGQKPISITAGIDFDHGQTAIFRIRAEQDIRIVRSEIAYYRSAQA